jgi:toxin YoeB
MQVVLLPTAKKDLDFWKHTGNKMILAKISLLTEDIVNNPFKGIGKPEPLKHQFSGCWSRRINREHRMIYEVKDDKIILYSLKGHY